MIPKYNEMYNEVLDVFYKHEKLQLKDLVMEVSDALNLSEEERKETLDNSNKTVIYDRVGWSKSYLVKAGLLETIKRGVYTISAEGKKVIESKVNINDEYLMKYEGFVNFVNRDGNGQGTKVTSQVNNTPIENIDNSIKMLSNQLSDELLEMILSKDPAFFERLELDLLNKMGYAFDEHSTIVTNYRCDEGIDGIIKEDKFGFNNIYVQAKRWTYGTVGRPEIQKFLGAVAGQGGTKGLFITTSTFTKEAIEYAKKQLSVKLVLVDGKMLTRLMMDYNLGVSVEKLYEIKRLDLDYFDTESN